MSTFGTSVLRCRVSESPTAYDGNPAYNQRRGRFGVTPQAFHSHYTLRMRLGVGLVSNGWMGRLHSRAYRQLPDRYPELDVVPDLVIACDPNANAAADAVSRLGYRQATNDYRAVIENPEVDVVSICAPNFLHPEIAEATTAAGKAFWIEKPMGRSVEESRAIHQAAIDAGVVTCVGFTYRQAPTLQEARRLIRSGALGRITHVNVGLIADYGSDPSGVFSWRFDRSLAGSGAIGDLLSHGFDLVQFLIGRIASVTALTSTFIPERPYFGDAPVSHFAKAEGGVLRDVENEDYAGVLARIDGGAVAVLEASRASVGPHLDTTVEVYGTEGSIRWGFEQLNDLLVSLRREGSRDGYQRLMAGPGMGEFSRFQPGVGFGVTIDDLKCVEGMLFVRSVLTGEQWAPSAGDGLAAALLCDATLESASSGLWTPIERPPANITFNAPVTGPFGS